MKLSKRDIERPGPCLYPDCGKTDMLQPGRPGGVAVYCHVHAAHLMAHPDEAKGLIR
jgi:hypothetical protein